MKRLKSASYSYSKEHIKDIQISSQKKRGMYDINEILFVLLMLCVVLYITGFGLKIIQTNQVIEEIIREGINYDAFREMKLDENDLVKSQEKINHIVKKNPEFKDVAYFDKMGYLTFSMMASSYNLIDNRLIDERTFTRGIRGVAATKSFQELYHYYNAVLSDLEYFPVPRIENEDIYYNNTWYTLRTYGGNRRHEGSDLMASNNLRGFFPVISMSDGIIEKMGWLEQGGYRIGVRSITGGYFYYAHLYSYAPQLKEGDQVIAGQLLGFMGDSGYGKEGTIGVFDVHLHLGIYVDSSIGEMSVNPFWILQFLEKYRSYYAIE